MIHLTEKQLEILLKHAWKAGFIYPDPKIEELEHPALVYARQVIGGLEDKHAAF